MNFSDLLKRLFGNFQFIQSLFGASTSAVEEPKPTGPDIPSIPDAPPTPDKPTAPSRPTLPDGSTVPDGSTFPDDSTLPDDPTDQSTRAVTANPTVPNNPTEFAPRKEKIMPQKHGQQTYFIEGEGFVGDDELRSEDSLEGLRAASPAAMPQQNRAFRFTRMFPNLPPFRPSVDALQELGLVMDDTFNHKDHPTMPAGYTYFGQFVDHDITRDKTSDLSHTEVSIEQITQGRSPSLDLDSIYGLGPGSPDDSKYEPNGIYLRLGSTLSSGEHPPESLTLANDLPRGDDPNNPLQANICDPRNDENLTVAQTHLAFLKFHNVVAKMLEGQGVPINQLFTKARETVVHHYQWIVLHDFLPRVVEPAILHEVLTNGCQFFQHSPGQPPAMPVEFAVAAYRFGHSMVRNEYNWNRNFPKATLGMLFSFTGGGNMNGASGLLTSWVIDWRRFYDFGDAHGLGEAPPMNKTRSIDTAMAMELKGLPEFEGEGIKAALAVRNLLRSRLIGLPSGQVVAQAMNAPVMSAAQVASGSHHHIMRRHGFENQTPLWYYVLKEAEIFHQGERLGPVGSRLLAETFVGLIQGSQHSILRGDFSQYWRPSLPSVRPGHFTMADLLLLVHELNPLGDQQPYAPPPPPPDHRYVVQHGETLRMLAARFYGNERQWPRIFNANRDKLVHPDRIARGTTIVIPRL